jgi:hypothetical protein
MGAFNLPGLKEILGHWDGGGGEQNVYGIILINGG